MELMRCPSTRSRRTPNTLSSYMTMTRTNLCTRPNFRVAIVMAVKTKNGSSWPRIVEEGKRYNVNAGIASKPDPTPEPTVPSKPDATPEPTVPSKPDPTPELTAPPPKPDPKVCANYEFFNRETKTPLQGSCDAYDQIYQNLCRRST